MSAIIEAVRWQRRCITPLGVLLLFFFTCRALASGANEGSGQLVLQDRLSGQRFDAVLMNTDVSMQIDGLVARVTYKQRFRNLTDSWVDATYQFPLPETAAVNAMRLQVGERIIEGEIHEKQRAKAIFQQAKAEGKKAGLVEQQRPNLFTTHVANVAPQEQIEVELTYIQAVDYQQGTFSLRLPTTFTPRYLPRFPAVTEEQPPTQTLVIENGWFSSSELAAWSGMTAEQSHTLQLDAQINAGMPLAQVSSLYHQISLAETPKGYRASLTQPALMDRDVVLQWQAPPSQQPTAAAFSFEDAGAWYHLLMLVPPQSPGAQARIGRDVQFIIDTSGSMAGESMRQAKQGLLKGLGLLKPGDRFNVIEFDSSTRTLFDDLVAYDQRSLSLAQSYVNGLQADGGTEMKGALRLAFDKADQHGDNLQQLVFLTDGAVGNEAELFSLIEQRLGRSRLFTIGIGTAPNSYFMRKAAEVGRGSFTHIGRTDEVERTMSALFAKIAEPVSHNINIDWGVDGVEQYPRQIPDLYQGEPLLVLAKTAAPLAQVSVAGQLAKAAWQRSITIGSPVENQGVGVLWARAKVEHLLDSARDSGNPTSQRAQIIELAKQFTLMTSYTSFVAVEQQPTRPAQASVLPAHLRNLIPQGNSMFAAAYPATATPMMMHLLIGISLLSLALFLGCCIIVLGRRRVRVK